MSEYLKERRPERKASKKELQEKVAAILDDIRENGDAAVRKYSEQFDNWNPESFRLSEDEIERAIRTLPETFIEDTKFVAEQIRTFAQKQLESMSEFEVETYPGVYLGQRLVPVEAVGNYVPGGRYPLIASAIMSTIPPKVAGVERVSSFTPPGKDGNGIPAEVIFALKNAGSDEIYSLGGVQAIGSAAYGTETINASDMVVGPGNAFVAEAKRQIFGDVGIDLPAGPSEILIIADDSADPDIVTADLLGQAEHDPNARAILISTSELLAKKVIGLIPEQLKTLPTAEVAGEAWEQNGEVVVVRDYEEAASLSDEYAIEHLEVQTLNNDWFLNRLKNYGSLFVGEESTVVYSDKAIGTNHILPTMRASRYTGGLWVGKFIKTLTYQKLTREGSKFIAPVAARQASAENMIAHAVTAEKRMKKYQ
ncbi:MAG TPA: histidinol dehydrogenase [Bacillales bacterium]|nr:histidinol dehydrogenase [Bacillales bacterium]